MASWVLCVGLVLLHLSCSVEAKLNYLVIFPSEIRCQHSEIICIHLEGAHGESRVQISLNLGSENITLIEKNFTEDSFSRCVPITVSKLEQRDLVGTLKISVENEKETIEKSTEVLVKNMRSRFLVQSDKTVYKPGQTVKFRILSINEDLQPKNLVLPDVVVQDPAQNRIVQWLNVSLNQGIAELSFPLSNEPPLGEYTIRLKDTVHPIYVEEYVLPKFEVTLQLPKVVMFNSELFSFHIRARYTYGKPVQGNYTVTVCHKSRYRNSKDDICSKFSGKLDRLGCDTIEVKSKVFKLSNIHMEMELKGEATITEDGTGVELSTSSRVPISNVINKVSFVNADRNYRPGIPYNGVVKVVDAGDNPIPGIAVYLTGLDLSMNETLVTDDNGQALFTANTDKWIGYVFLKAQTNFEVQQYFNINELYPEYGEAQLKLKYYSRDKSYLKLHSLDRVLPCEGQQEVQVEYIIKQTELKDEHFNLYFLVTSEGSIQDYGSLQINIGNRREDLHGKETLTLHLKAGTFSRIQALVYTILPNGYILADLRNYKIQRCFKNKVSVGFSPDEVLPGMDVSLQVQAAPGSLCGLRVVDQSVVLMKPEKELTADKVLDLFGLRKHGTYDYVDEDFEYYDDQCSPDYIMQYPTGDEDEDLYRMFKLTKLKILTWADIKKTRSCQLVTLRNYMRPSAPRGPQDVPERAIDKPERAIEQPKKKEEKVRIYFPETWLWELVSIGESGNADLHHKAPDTITDWNGGAICLGQSGFGLSPPTSFRVFQPFFVDLTLPYSVVRGETFTLKASVFNYLKHCIKIKIMLGPNEELEQTPCTDCTYSSCLCADESKTFYWNLKATKLGEVNITVRTETVNTKELCQNEIPVIPKQGATDTIVKPLLVQPGGILVEKSHGSLLCIQEGEGNAKTEEVSLKFPKNILKDSERAYVTVMGDLMGTALQNLDHLLAMPNGCGEQNMILFAPNIFILQYLEKTHQITDEIKSKAIRFLESGYQRQLTYKHPDGSYSAFGTRDPEGNTWLSAFVIKSFSQARPYIYIDESHLKQTLSWLKRIRNSNGCFRNVGRLIHTNMKGGVEDEVSLSAYVTIALIEAGVSLDDPLVSDAVHCLQVLAVNVTNVYTLALLAYTFTLCGTTENRNAVLDKLEEKAIREDRQLHWKRDFSPPVQDSHWSKAPCAEVELAAYMLLTVISWSHPEMSKGSEIVNWLTKQQNPYGGFSSTQDTIVALQALAKHAEITFSDKSDTSVTVSAESGFLEKFHVDRNNRLLLQRAPLPAVSGDYKVTVTGKDCVFVQAVMQYNVPPARSDASFSLRVTTQSIRGSLHVPVTTFEIHISANYTGSRERTNMAVIEVKMLSGYIPVKSTIKKLEKDRLIQRSEIQMDMVTLYLNEVERNSATLSFIVEQDVEVTDLKPATVKLYDYYEKDEQAVAEYNHPSNMDGNADNAR